MAVTDLTGMSDLPWWARQGPGPAGGPAATPSGAAPAGVDPTQWLQYLQQMYSGGGPANANMAAALTSPNPHGDAPPNFSAVNQQPGPPMQLPGAVPPTPGPPGYLNSTSAIVPPAPAGGLRPPNTANLPPGSLNPTILGSYYNMPTPSGGGGGAALAAATNPNAPAPNPDVPAANVQPVKGPLATGGQGGQGAASNPRFIGIDRPNAPAEGGSPYGRPSGLQGTALNLAGLFGQPQPQGAPAAVPGAPRAIPGPLAGGVTQDDLYPARAAMRGMGRQPMNPTQLASAVRQPNWWPA
jgi:hypothetical protein